MRSKVRKRTATAKDKNSNNRQAPDTRIVNKLFENICSSNSKKKVMKLTDHVEAVNKSDAFKHSTPLELSRGISDGDELNLKNESKHEHLTGVKLKTALTGGEQLATKQNIVAPCAGSDSSDEGVRYMLADDFDATDVKDEDEPSILLDSRVPFFDPGLLLSITPPGKTGQRVNDSRSHKKVSDAPVERRLSIRQTECAFKYKEIVIKKMTHFTQVIVNAGSRTKHGLNPQALNELTNMLNSAKCDVQCRVVLLTGSGTTFCTGVDLDYLTSNNVHNAATMMAFALSEFIRTLIMFPKPVVAAVNGIAMGCGVAILPLCDIVYASDKATFCTPYSQLGQTPEGALSCTLPQAIGASLANDMLLAGRTLTAVEAHQTGLVAQVFWPTRMMEEVIPRVNKMSLCSSKILDATKSLIRSQHRERLLAANETEARLLANTWSSDECQKSLKTFLDQWSDYVS